MVTRDREGEGDERRIEPRTDTAFFAVERYINGVPFFLQPLLEGAHQGSVVFDQEDAHGTPRR